MDAMPVILRWCSRKECPGHAGTNSMTSWNKAVGTWQFIGYHPFFFGILEIINSSRGSKGTGRSRERQEKGVVRRGTLNVRSANLGGSHGGSRVLNSAAPKSGVDGESSTPGLSSYQKY